LQAVACERFQVTIAGGLGPLNGKAFRIGHLGEGKPTVNLDAIADGESARLCQGMAIWDGGGRGGMSRCRFSRYGENCIAIPSGPSTTSTQLSADLCKTVTHPNCLFAIYLIAQNMGMAEGLSPLEFERRQAQRLKCV
jgi:hypothetical protein